MKIIVETKGERDESVRKSELKNAIIQAVMRCGYSSKEITVHIDVKKN